MTQIKIARDFFGASVDLKYYCLLLTVVKYEDLHLLNTLLFLLLVIVDS